MGGGSSKSSTTTKTTQNITTDTKQADASGVITGNVLQGEITYTESFGPEVQQAFSQLIDLSAAGTNAVSGAFKDLIDLSNRSLDLTERAGSAALEGVQSHVEQQSQPELSVIRQLVPIFALFVAAISLKSFFGKK